MHDQPRYGPLQRSAFFPDGQASRPLVPGTVAREPTDAPPPERITLPLLRRGRERYDVFCSPCHDRTGSGRGIVVQRGFKAPPPLHDERLRAVPLRYFADVTAQGFGQMPPYGAQVPPADRWAIAAYVRALQLSQHASAKELPPAERARLPE
jgi:mono/diheme cytochrome c family protein